MVEINIASAFRLIDFVRMSPDLRKNWRLKFGVRFIPGGSRIRSSSGTQWIIHPHFRPDVYSTVDDAMRKWWRKLCRSKSFDIQPLPVPLPIGASSPIRTSVCHPRAGSLRPNRPKYKSESDLPVDNDVVDAADAPSKYWTFSFIAAVAVPEALQADAIRTDVV